MPAYSSFALATLWLFSRAPHPNLVPVQRFGDAIKLEQVRHADVPTPAQHLVGNLVVVRPRVPLARVDMAKMILDVAIQLLDVLQHVHGSEHVLLQ